MMRWRRAAQQINRASRVCPDVTPADDDPFRRIPFPRSLAPWFDPRCDWCGRKPAWHFDAVPVWETNIPEGQRQRPTDSPDQVNTMPMNVCNHCLPKVVHWKFDWDQTMERHGPRFSRNVWTPCKLQPISKEEL